jgi:hypothetical protein
MRVDAGRLHDLGGVTGEDVGVVAGVVADDDGRLRFPLEEVCR